MTDAAVDRLHPAIVHHVVNTLGWQQLRPLQSDSIGPLLDGEDAVLVAPTAGGKTEAAVLPLLSRMLTEEWSGLTVLYVCPLRALLNNLHPRLDHYAGLVGRRCGLWHGDIGPGERTRLVRDPPDILLTTPESLEAILISSRVEHERLLAGLRAVVIDEAHAFGADDRGWHLQCVLARVARLAGRELQRVALSATVGNPEGLLAWLTSATTRTGRVVAPVAEGVAADVTLDHVGSLENAAIVISRLHRGEKRLVFVDSRARVERLATALRQLDVEVYVSHGSLGRDERRRAEDAFAQGRDCVIVATSTLELGIDVGDLDRMIQIDAPGSVASFLQRLGRTGRRSGSARNALLLSTDDSALLQCAGLLRAWRGGFVEPVVAPPLPFHIAAQQCLALTLQERGVGDNVWQRWLGEPFVLGDAVAAHIPAITAHLLEAGMLTDDQGVLGIGGEGETSYGRQHFVELVSVFTSAPVFSVRHGRTEIGLVPDQALQLRDPEKQAGGPSVLLLGGRPWQITHVDWQRRVVNVVPTDRPGVARWFGSAQPLGAELCRSIREVLAGDALPGVNLSERATTQLGILREAHSWVRSGGTTLLRDEKGRVQWWTFGGLLANVWLSALLSPLRTEASARDNLSITLDSSVTVVALRDALANGDLDTTTLQDGIVPEALDGLKFSECLPRELALRVVTARLDDREHAAETLSEPLHAVVLN